MGESKLGNIRVILNTVIVIMHFLILNHHLKLGEPPHTIYLKTNHAHDNELGTSKSSAFPGASSHQLEGPGGDLLSGCCHANDDASAPSFVAGLQGSPLPPRDNIRTVSHQPDPNTA